MVISIDMPGWLAAVGMLIGLACLVAILFYKLEK